MAPTHTFAPPPLHRHSHSLSPYSTGQPNGAQNTAPASASAQLLSSPRIARNLPPLNPHRPSPNTCASSLTLLSTCFARPDLGPLFSLLRRLHQCCPHQPCTDRPLAMPVCRFCSPSLDIYLWFLARPALSTCSALDRYLTCSRSTRSRLSLASASFFFLRSLRDAFAIITASQSPPPLHPPDFDLGVRQTHRSRSPRSRLDLLSLCCGPSFDTASQSHRRTQIPIAAAVLPRDRLAVRPPAQILLEPHSRPLPLEACSRSAMMVARSRFRISTARPHSPTTVFRPGLSAPPVLCSGPCLDLFSLDHCPAVARPSVGPAFLARPAPDRSRSTCSRSAVLALLGSIFAPVLALYSRSTCSRVDRSISAFRSFSLSLVLLFRPFSLDLSLLC